MTFLQFVQIIGLPSVFGAIILALAGWLWKQAQALKALKLGVQAMLRNMLIQLFEQCQADGCASVSKRQNFENMYQQYHSLGKNGIMDDIRNKFLALPIYENETRS